MECEAQKYTYLLEEYYDGINNGGKYECDKCNKVALSPQEYISYIRGQFHYCEICWNYIHLKKGTCDSCGNESTNRGEYRSLTLSCSCGGKIYMEIED